MDILRKIFGLEPTTTSPTSKDGLDGPTAPLATSTKVMGVQPVAPMTVDEDIELTTKPVEDGRTQKLPELDATLLGLQKGKRIIYGQHSDVGQVRTNNQDAISTFICSSTSSEELPEFGVFVVADGMGGHHHGEKASAMTVRAVTRYVVQNIYLHMLESQDQDADRPTVTEILREAVQEANREVAAKVPEGGTTVTATVIIGDLAYVGHVGDSRAYLIDKDSIEHLTRDHSLVQRLIELEQLTQEEAADHPQKNVLYRAIGQNETIDVDAITRRMLPGSRLLLCSDGLWNLVPDEEIRSVVNVSATPQIASETLVKLANDRGGSDNISVIIVRMPE